MIRTNKIDAACRQIECAIRLPFSNEDPFSIHTVISAAFRIVRDLSELSGKSNIHESLKLMIKPDKEKIFWSRINKATNYLKHAKDDSSEMLEVGEELNESSISITCLYYESLGYEQTPIMKGFMAWYALINPDFLLDSTPFKEIVEDSSFNVYREMPHHEKLQLGKQLLELAILKTKSI